MDSFFCSLEIRPCLLITRAVHRIEGLVVDIRPLKLQASLWAHDLAQKYELVAVGHRFGKVSVLATTTSQIYPEKLEWTSNADQLKFNDRLAKNDTNLIGWAIVAFVRSWLGNFRETQKLQRIQTHKTRCKKSRWHTGYNPSVSTCGPTFDPQHWHLIERCSMLAWSRLHHVVVTCIEYLLFIWITIHDIVGYRTILNRYPT